jgi:transposase InsO family protein
MSQMGLHGISPRLRHPTATVPGDDRFPVPGLVNREFGKGAPDAAWFSDIAYSRIGQGWACLRVVRDDHTRRAPIRIAAPRMRADKAGAALKQVVVLCSQLPDKIVFHVDRSRQFTPEQFAARRFGG